MIFAGALALSAKTPQQVKASLDSIAPPDTIVKVAYIKGGSAANFARESWGASVYVVSSEDGIVRKVNTVVGHPMMVNITADGKRVLFWERGSSRTYIVDWDGKNERVVTSDGMLIEYWRDKTNGTDWALIEYDTWGQYRVNVDKPAVSIQVSTLGASKLSGGLSDDGTRVVVHKDGAWASAAVMSTTVQHGNGGCQASMRAGPVAQWSCNESGHNNSLVNNPDGTLAFKISMGTDRTGEGARFTQHPNYFSFMLGKYNETASVAYCEPKNPVLLRVSDNKRITIEDGLNADQFCGDLDAVFLPKSVSNRTSIRPSISRTPDALLETYSINGRRLTRGKTDRGAHQGIVITRHGDTRVFLSRKVLH